MANTTVGPQQRIDFGYDWQGRRISKKVWPNTAGTNTPTSDLVFVYDGWNLMAELNATNKAVVRSYFWGLDLSGSEQGAGGVGGLLGVKPANGTAQFVAFDGNGNVAALVDGTSGAYTANYEYGPFAEAIRVSGAQGAANPLRFSTKFTDDETGLLYYGHRFYNPSTGRWNSRDPIGEDGGKNLYAFARNQAVGKFDAVGHVDDGYPGPSHYDGPIGTMTWSCTLSGGVPYLFPSGWYKRLVDNEAGFSVPQLCIQKCFYVCKLAGTSPVPLVLNGRRYTPGVTSSTKIRWYRSVCPNPLTVVDVFGYSHPLTSALY